MALTILPNLHHVPRLYHNDILHVTPAKTHMAEVGVPPYVLS